MRLIGLIFQTSCKLGFKIDENMAWKIQVKKLHVCQHYFCRYKSFIRCSISSILNQKSLVSYFVLSCRDYCALLYCNLPDWLIKKLQRMKNSFQVYFGWLRFPNARELLKIIVASSYRKTAAQSCVVFVYKIQLNLAPKYLIYIVILPQLHNEKCLLGVPKYEITLGGRAFFEHALR